MAVASIAGASVVGGTICLPRVGVWHADLVVDTPTPPVGAQTITFGDAVLELKGTVVRSGEHHLASYVRMVGGAGGLGRMAAPKFYQQATVRIVLLDLLRTAGEILSESCESAILATALARWTTMAQPVGLAIASLLEAAGGTRPWRFLPDGTWWVGPETWPISAAEGECQEMEHLPSEAWLDYGIERPIILPGTTLAGQRISYVEAKIEPETVRTRIWAEAA